MSGTYVAERPVDSFRSSTNRWLLGSFAGWLTILSCVIGIGLVIIAWRWLQNMASAYEITDQRLIVRRGLIMKSIDEIELYRVKDVRVRFSLINQLADIGTITITSSDRTTGNQEFVLRDVPAARERREGIRKLVDRARQRRGVRELDVDAEDGFR
ncbi:PH domain-containing protein [Sphingomonadaceae bacterium OTU29MARTA1]|uniref:PH domain-containing protein n=1 Tax=Sphingomonas sp. Leaf37 TaxID=2876552 RepID=UPI001E4BB4E0|nr:PH domain-containing protein [Sphingomonas sp. Leaf37]USU03408.1 PH domain-containing protein [Sphingomonadaceae bacterium OTU29LAMAA1]USU10259.1 PH domain-containing protein [Sphingomonadaceae bacterium OTU29MARTA1]USU13706.1 PH domain-containing protein [Sphingomonadaceae bacterium OTU29THOMA1]